MSKRICTFGLAGLLLIIVILTSAFLWLCVFPEENGSEALRNVVLIVVAIIGLPLVLWRSIVAAEQVEMAAEQVKISQRGQRNEYYHKALEMLANHNMSVRITGIYALDKLARDHPKEFHIPVMQLLCNFIRTYRSLRQDDSKIPNIDFMEAIYVIGCRDNDRIKIEIDAKYAPNLFGSDFGNILFQHPMFSLSNSEKYFPNFTGIQFSAVNLKESNLQKAKLNRASLNGVNLTFTDLSHADLNFVRFYKVNFDKANLRGARIDGARFESVIGLTRDMLREAKVIDENHPPEFIDTFDVNTGKPILSI